MDSNGSDEVEYFNLEFGNNLNDLLKIHDVINRLSKYEDELNQEVNPLNTNPTYITSYMKNATCVLHRVQHLKNRCCSLKAATQSELDSLKSVKESFSAKIKELKKIELLHFYLLWILKIEKNNTCMEDALLNNNQLLLIELYEKFVIHWKVLRISDCKNLAKFAEKTMLYWHNVLREKFENEFLKILGNLHWPMSSKNIFQSTNYSTDSLQKFSQLFLLLCKIVLPPEYSTSEALLGTMQDSSILLPIGMMIQPLQKRFFFHFMGKKPTNNREKPEWYLSQVLTWITDHSSFMENIVQPILKKEKLPCTSARLQLMRGLVHLTVLRLKLDVETLLNDDKLYSHTIDEVLLFSQELCNQGYPSSFPNPVKILMSESYFSKWRSLEHQSALQKMDKFLSLDTAWKSCYQDENELDETHVPESAELFVTLLLTMTERYCILSDRDCQLSFLELQLELLDDFRLRHHQLSQCELQETLQPNYCGIMNAIHHITNVLEEWNNLPFFLQLYAYKKRKSVCFKLLKDSEKQSLYLGKRQKLKLETCNKEEYFEASVFDEAIKLFQHMQNDFLQAMCDQIMLDIKAKSRAYRKEKWFCMTTIHDKRLMEISLAAFPMLQIINSSLHNLKEMLASPLFTKIWQQLAAELNIYIFEEVILQNSFNEGGANQLHFDMIRNLFPIFGTFTMKPDKYFNLIRDSCTLLNLNIGPALLLKETLKQQENLEFKNNALEEIGVYSLSSSQSLIILSQKCQMES